MANIVFSKGGLGNQLFIAAACLELKDNVDVRIEISSHSGSERDYFQVHALVESAGVEVLTSKLLKPVRSLMDIVAAETLRIGNVRFHNSYFQDLSVVENQREPILRFFGDIETDHQSAALHFRAGDYLLKKNAATYATLESYFCDSLRHLASMGFRRLVIFSDGEVPAAVLRSARQNFKISYASKNLSAMETLKQMAGAGAIISANSTFSWWASWIVIQRSGLAISPRRWFTNKPKPPLCDSRWVEL